MKKSILLPAPIGKSSFPIVAVGSSAGGLDALERFFGNMPIDSGIAFVVISHLDPHHKSLLPGLLQNYTKMQIRQIESRNKFVPNVIYIMPPGKSLVFSRGMLQLLPRKEPYQAQLPIDAFFASIAQQQRHQVICIILSGTGTDGTLGLKAIKNAGGKVIVQTPSSAQYDGMPCSAINTGLVDAVLLPEQMPAQLLKDITPVTIEIDNSFDPLQHIFILLKNCTGHDFSLYKRKTIQRRIEKRMAVYQFDQLVDYVHYLQQSPQEIDHLFKELLIGVTQFFRDPEAFAALKQQLLFKLHNEVPAGNCLRIWIPGCSRGEEVYSIVIILQECMQELKRQFSVQIFATDLDEAAINIARAGVYPPRIVADVSAERLRRFFTKGADDTYIINKNLRKMVIFSCHNIIKDPPFIKLDLLCCRNVLIYFDTVLQKKVLPLFHYSLKLKGLLFLGTCETIAGFTNLFSVVDKKWKIFQRKEITLAHQPRIMLPIIALKPATSEVPVKGKQMTNQILDISQLAEKFLLHNYGPPCVIVNKAGDILYIHGKIGKYLEPAPGKVSFNVTEMASPHLKTELISALHQAAVQHKEIFIPNLAIKENSDSQVINLIVRPLTEQETMLGLTAVIFETVNPPLLVAADEKKITPTGKWAKEITKLKQELQEAKANLQIAVEEHNSSNEELQSVNEELQSNNEEIETSKEELQSLNEELITVNSELQARIDQLSSANDDMKNLLDSTEIATLFLDNNLCIKRFTPKITQLINLIPLDIGRPISHFVSNLNYASLSEDAAEVLKTLRPKSLDVKNKEGYWYCIRIIPYRTITNEVDGVVITFSNIHAQKHAEEELKRLNSFLRGALDYAESIIATVHEPLVVLDADFKVISVNPAFYKMFQVTPKATLGQSFYELEGGRWNIPKLKELLEKIISKDNFSNDIAVEHVFPRIGGKKFLLNVRRIFRHDMGKPLILLAMEEITGINEKK